MIASGAEFAVMRNLSFFGLLCFAADADAANDLEDAPAQSKNAEEYCNAECGATWVDDEKDAGEDEEYTTDAEHEAGAIGAGIECGDDFHDAADNQPDAQDPCKDDGARDWAEDDQDASDKSEDAQGDEPRASFLAGWLGSGDECEDGVDDGVDTPEHHECEDGANRREDCDKTKENSDNSGDDQHQAGAFNKIKHVLVPLIRRKFVFRG